MQAAYSHGRIFHVLFLIANRATATAATTTAAPIHRLEELELGLAGGGDAAAELEALALDAQQGFLAGASGWEER
jgi:hypothetical protein